MKKKPIKKTTKRILIISASVVAAALIAAVVAFFPMLQMRPAKTGQVENTNVFALRNIVVNAYFIKAQDGYIMIDAGSNAAAIGRGMSGMGISPADVKWILLTHSDYDHVGALPLFPDAEIYMGEDELPLVNGTTKRNGPESNALPVGLERLTLLTDSQEIALGGVAITCIKSPGHTIGSVSFLADGKYIFIGDAFKYDAGKTDVHPYAMDKTLAKESLEKLKASMAQAEMIFTGHYGVHSIG